MRFSERMGYKPVREQLQLESMDIRLRNRIWNTLLIVLDNVDPHFHWVYSNELWGEFWNLTTDEIPVSPRGNIYWSSVMEKIKRWFYSGDTEWYDIYDIIEFTIKYSDYDFISNMNIALDKEKAGYSIVDKKITPITSKEEIQSIEEAVDNTKDKYNGVHTHLQTALSLLSDRENPDYRNSIKESISAVEALCQKITGDDKATLGKALKILGDKEQLHGALEKAFSSLYGYVSDGDGIRHAMMDDGKELDFHDAKYMLVTCTAFINLMIGKLDT